MAALAILLGGVLASDPAAQPPGRSAPAALAERAFAGFSPGNTQAQVLRLRDEAGRTGSANAYALLGLNYGVFGRLYPILILHSCLLP